MSAPLPCWSSTRPMIASATSTCSTISTLVQPIMSSSFRRRLNDGEKFLRDQRRPADQAAVDVRHGEQCRCVAGLHAFLRNRLSREARIVYGGSVKAGNATALFAMPDIDGGLIGGASLGAQGFLAIVQAAAEGWRHDW